MRTGERPEEVQRLELGELIFRQGLSVREDADATSGRGVGLAAVKQELDRLGGSVRVRSSRDAGTQFVFRVPINPVAGVSPTHLRKVAS